MEKKTFVDSYHSYTIQRHNFPLSLSYFNYNHKSPLLITAQFEKSSLDFVFWILQSEIDYTKKNFERIYSSEFYLLWSRTNLQDGGLILFDFCSLWCDLVRVNIFQLRYDNQIGQESALLNLLNYLVVGFLTLNTIRLYVQLLKNI